MPPKHEIICQYKQNILKFSVSCSIDEIFKKAEDKLKSLVLNPEDWSISY